MWKSLSLKITLVKCSEASMDPYLPFENPSPTSPMVYQGLARDRFLCCWLLFSLRAFSGAKSNCMGLSKYMHSSLSRLCLGPLGSFGGCQVWGVFIIRFDLTFLEGASPQFLVSLYYKHFFVPYKMIVSWGSAEHNEGVGGIVFFSRTVG